MSSRLFIQSIKKWSLWKRKSHLDNATALTFNLSNHFCYFQPNLQPFLFILKKILFSSLIYFYFIYYLLFIIYYFFVSFSFKNSFLVSLFNPKIIHLYSLSFFSLSLSVSVSLWLSIFTPFLTVSHCLSLSLIVSHCLSLSLTVPLGFINSPIHTILFGSREVKEEREDIENRIWKIRKAKKESKFKFKMA